MATADHKQVNQQASARDRRTLGNVLAAARTPCPTAATAYDAETNPQTYDEFAIVLDQPLVRLMLMRLAPLMPNDDARRLIEGPAYRWWSGCSLRPGDRYVQRRKRFVEFVEKLHVLVAAALPAIPGGAQPEDQSDGLRVSYREAIQGRPDIGLPATPKTTLHRWVQNLHNDGLLGVDKRMRCKPSAQLLLVEGLRSLHRSPRRSLKQRRRGREAIE